MHRHCRKSIDATSGFLGKQKKSFQDLADRGVKSKAGAVALALFRFRCICIGEEAAVQSLPTKLSHRHKLRYAARLFCL